MSLLLSSSCSISLRYVGLFHYLWRFRYTITIHRSLLQSYSPDSRIRLVVSHHHSTVITLTPSSSLCAELVWPIPTRLFPYDDWKCRDQALSYWQNIHPTLWFSNCACVFWNCETLRRMHDDSVKMEEGAEELLSLPTDESQVFKKTGTRRSCNHSNLCGQYRLQRDRDYVTQYAHIYFSRLEDMRYLLERAAIRKWGM